MVLELSRPGKTTQFCNIGRNGFCQLLVTLIKSISLCDDQRLGLQVVLQRLTQLGIIFSGRISGSHQIRQELKRWPSNDRQHCRPLLRFLVDVIGGKILVQARRIGRPMPSRDIKRFNRTMHCHHHREHEKRLRFFFFLNLRRHCDVLQHPKEKALQHNVSLVCSVHNWE